MNLRVRVQVTDALNVNNDQLVAGSLEGEVTESLWRLPATLVVDETRVRVVLDVVAVDEVLDVKERLVLTLVELVDGHHENVDLLWWIVSVEFFAPQLCVHLSKHKCSRYFMKNSLQEVNVKQIQR